MSKIWILGRLTAQLERRRTEKLIKDYVELTRSFENCDVDSSTFGKVDHIGVAYEMLRNYEFLDASVRYSKCINTIATLAGAAQKFNTTITLAFLSLIAERMHATDY